MKLSSTPLVPPLIQLSLDTPAPSSSLLVIQDKVPQGGMDLSQRLIRPLKTALPVAFATAIPNVAYAKSAISSVYQTVLNSHGSVLLVLGALAMAGFGMYSLAKHTESEEFKKIQSRLEEIQACYDPSNLDLNDTELSISAKELTNLLIIYRALERYVRMTSEFNEITFQHLDWSKLRTEALRLKMKIHFALMLELERVTEELESIQNMEFDPDVQANIDKIYEEDGREKFILTDRVLELFSTTYSDLWVELRKVRKDPNPSNIRKFKKLIDFADQVDS